MAGSSISAIPGISRAACGGPNRVNARAAVLIGEEEIARNVVAVRDLDSGEQYRSADGSVIERVARATAGVLRLSRRYGSLFRRTFGAARPAPCRAAGSASRLRARRRRVRKIVEGIQRAQPDRRRHRQVAARSRRAFLARRYGGIERGCRAAAARRGRAALAAGASSRSRAAGKAGASPEGCRRSAQRDPRGSRRNRRRGGGFVRRRALSHVPEIRRVARLAVRDPRSFRDRSRRV